MCISSVSGDVFEVQARAGNGAQHASARARGRFDVALASTLDRLGRSLIDLLDTWGELDTAHVALVLHQ